MKDPVPYTVNSQLTSDQILNAFLSLDHRVSAIGHHSHDGQSQRSGHGVTGLCPHSPQRSISD